MPITKTTNKKEKIKSAPKKSKSMVGAAEKKKQSSVAKRTSKVVTSTKENSQKPRSKLDARMGESVGKRSAGGTSNKATGRGTAISNKALEKRTARDLKEVQRARKADVGKKAARKAAVKKVTGKLLARAVPGLGAVLLAKDVASAAARESKKSRASSKGKGLSGQMKRKKKK